MIDREHQPYDKSSKWLIQHHGDSMLRLANVARIAAWRPAQAEVVQPRRLPDGLLEVRLEGESQDDLFLIEVATYPERRVEEQLTGDLMLVYLDRGELPEAITFVLRPKGKYRVPESRDLCSRHGFASCRVNWRVVELWQIPGEALLQAGDVGLIPWVPLTDHPDPPETVMQRCREEIEKHAPAGEMANLLAVTQVLAYLRYNDVGLLTILGGRRIMLESPLIDDLVMEKYGDVIAEKTREAQEAAREAAQEAAREAAQEAARESIVTVLEARFGDLPSDLLKQIATVVDQKDLKQLVRATGICPDLDAFRDLLPRN